MFANKKPWYTRGPSIILTLLLICAAALLGWMGTDFAVKHTSGHEFCSSCHSMKPLQQSFLLDAHGGNNANGIQAQCTDCHLPHDSHLNYWYTKVTTSAYDIWMESTGKAQNVDWHAKRARVAEYTYDSGCLKCHNNLQQMPIDEDNLPVHQFYFQESTQSRCVTCHTVGHKNLTELLPPRP